MFPTTNQHQLRSGQRVMYLPYILFQHQKYFFPTSKRKIPVKPALSWYKLVSWMVESVLQSQKSSAPKSKGHRFAASDM